MDAAAGFILVLIFLLLLALLSGYAYRRRADIAKWLNYPYFACEDRKLYLQRKLEDAQKELEAIEAQEKKSETGG